jgi:hypothetical protein
MWISSWLCLPSAVSLNVGVRLFRANRAEAVPHQDVPPDPSQIQCSLGHQGYEVGSGSDYRASGPPRGNSVVSVTCKKSWLNDKVKVLKAKPPVSRVRTVWDSTAVSAAHPPPHHHHHHHHLHPVIRTRTGSPGERSGLYLVQIFWTTREPGLPRGHSICWNRYQVAFLMIFPPFFSCFL